MKQTDDKNFKKQQNEFVSMLHELTSSDENIISSLNDCIKLMEEEL